ncbi:hypothetical protein [Streptomyces luteogriseus]|uniref:hypothetical protein n=1 Tax=Streptomyces luteogriseus TaxID=68233 RepID=UPI003817E5D0
MGILHGRRAGRESNDGLSISTITLAYEAATEALKAQNHTLTNLRNRAAGLLASAALVTSFASTLGLTGRLSVEGRALPIWEVITLMALLILIGGLSMAVMWPAQIFFWARCCRNSSLFEVWTQ